MSCLGRPTYTSRRAENHEEPHRVSAFRPAFLSVLVIKTLFKHIGNRMKSPRNPHRCLAATIPAFLTVSQTSSGATIVRRHPSLRSSACPRSVHAKRLLKSLCEVGISTDKDDFDLVIHGSPEYVGRSTCQPCLALVPIFAKKSRPMQ